MQCMFRQCQICNSSFDIQNLAPTAIESEVVWAWGVRACRACLHVCVHACETVWVGWGGLPCSTSECVRSAGASCKGATWNSSKCGPHQQDILSHCISTGAAPAAAQGYYPAAVRAPDSAPGHGLSQHTGHGGWRCIILMKFRAQDPRPPGGAHSAASLGASITT